MLLTLHLVMFDDSDWCFTVSYCWGLRFIESEDIFTLRCLWVKYTTSTVRQHVKVFQPAIKIIWFVFSPTLLLFVLVCLWAWQSSLHLFCSFPLLTWLHQPAHLLFIISSACNISTPVLQSDCSVYLYGTYAQHHVVLAQVFTFSSLTSRTDL